MADGWKPCTILRISCPVFQIHKIHSWISKRPGPIQVVVSKIIPLGAWVLGSTASEKVRFHIILWSLWFCTVLIVTLELHIDNVICLLTKQSDYIERSSFERSRTSRRTIALTAGSETYDGAKSCRTNSKSQQPNPKPIQSFLAWLEWLEWLECLYFSQRAPFIAQNICKSPELSYSALTPCTTTSTDLYFLWTWLTKYCTRTAWGMRICSAILCFISKGVFPPISRL